MKKYECPPETGCSLCGRHKGLRFDGKLWLCRKCRREQKEIEEAEEAITQRDLEKVLDEHKGIRKFIDFIFGRKRKEP